MIHSCSGAVRQNVASAWGRWRLQHGGHTPGVAYGNPDRLAIADIHDPEASLLQLKV
jgi:hypothetical protein